SGARTLNRGYSRNGIRGRIPRPRMETEAPVMQVQKSPHRLPNCIIGLFAIVVLLAGIIASAGCTSQAQEPASAPTSPATAASVEKIEVYHFHPTRQCSSCIA